MEAHTFLLSFLIILLSARIFGEIATHMKMPAVLGELFAGIIIGPSMFGLIEPFQALTMMAEIGLILLLFDVGLRTDVNCLFKVGGKSLIVAIAGFLFPFILTFSGCYFLFDLSFITSLFIGGTFTATSIGVTVRVLKDLKCDQTYTGQIILGAAVLDDIFGVVLLAILYEFSVSGTVSIMNVGTVLLWVSAFFVLAPLTAKILSTTLKHIQKFSEISGLIPTTIFSLILFFAWVAHQIGAPELLGGFAAGLALSRRFFLPLGTSFREDPEFSHDVEGQIKPIIYLFTPIFFVHIGISLHLHEIDWTNINFWYFTTILFILAFIGKMAAPFFLKERNKTRIAIGTAMIPRGEVGLIFAEFGRVSGTMDSETHTAVVLVIVLTTLLAPFIMEWICDNYHTDKDKQCIPPEKG